MPHCPAGQIVKLQIGLIKKLDLEILVTADHHFCKRVLWPMEGHLGREKVQ